MSHFQKGERVEVIKDDETATSSFAGRLGTVIQTVSLCTYGANATCNIVALDTPHTSRENAFRKNRYCFKDDELQRYREMPDADKKRRLVIVQALETWQEFHCLYLLPTTGRDPAFVTCMRHTEAFCLICGRPTCDEHLSDRLFYLSNREKTSTFYLCQACAMLPMGVRHTILQMVRLSQTGHAHTDRDETKQEGHVPSF